ADTPGEIGKLVFTVKTPVWREGRVIPLFILLKVTMVLLFPNRSSLPLLVGCGFSLRALLLLRSPHISTKPSTVFLVQLASSDCLILLQWTLWLSVKLSWWTEKPGRGETVSDLCLQLLDAHHLASLLLLGLLGLEATLVSRWPQQTVRFRTSHWAHLSCALVWMFVLLEFTLSLHLQTLRKTNPDNYWSQLQDSKLSFVGLVPPSFLLSTFSPCLRKLLWLMNLWLHYALTHFLLTKLPK
uniref:G-protein coupled receptors family 1 profile domain-containing protein n=1 Tax=Cynoglossus semilaevis TaxID=244447 RepID=A0A3P8WV09_CYNSE